MYQRCNIALQHPMLQRCSNDVASFCTVSS